MSTLGPIAQIIKLLAKKSGKTLGKTVAKDIKTAENMVPWTHKDKIMELKTDSGISKTYIKELISKSSKKDQLEQIKTYLSDSSKAGNLNTRERYDLFTAIGNKLNHIEKYKAFKDIIEHGTDHL